MFLGMNETYLPYLPNFEGSLTLYLQEKKKKVETIPYK